MKELLLTLLIGIAAGVIDVLPMIKMKLDKYSEISAFVHYLIAPFIIFNTELFGMAWWLKGGVINLALAVPVVILAAKDDKTSAPPMIVMSVVLGTVIGIVGHFTFSRSMRLKPGHYIKKESTRPAIYWIAIRLLSLNP